MRIHALDIGNTRTSSGIFKDGELEERRDFETSELGEMRSQLVGTGIDLCVVSCVSSSAAYLTERFKRMFRCRVIEVQPLESPLVIHYDHPEKLGQDRIVNALGANRHSNHGAIVIDMGTATHFDVIDPAGEFWGGPILAGVETMLEALVQRIPHLPRPELDFDLEPLSQSTLSAIRTGTILSAAGGIDRIVSEIKGRVTYEPRTILTGGNASVIAPYIQYDEYVPELTLEGLCEYGRLKMCK